MFVADVMTADPVTVHAGATVKHALVLMARHRITSLPVVDPAGRLQGVVSEADLIRESVPRDPRAGGADAGGTGRRPVPPRHVEEVMTPHAIAVRTHTDLATAVDMMTSTSVKSLPVVDDDDALVGMVSRSDVVRILARSDGAVERDVDEVLCALGHRDWLVEVHDGRVELSGPDNLEDRALARAAAVTVPGVMDVRVTT